MQNYEKADTLVRPHQNLSGTPGNSFDRERFYRELELLVFTFYTELKCEEGSFFWSDID